jgi:hypothetical protein
MVDVDDDTFAVAVAFCNHKLMLGLLMHDCQKFHGNECLFSLIRALEFRILPKRKTDQKKEKEKNKKGKPAHT